MTRIFIAYILAGMVLVTSAFASGHASESQLALFNHFTWIPADDLFTTNTADWENGDALCPLAVDSNNSALHVRLCDDTTDEGMGFEAYTPSVPLAAITGIEIVTVARAETGPGGNVSAQITLSCRPLNAGTAIGSWSTPVDLTVIDIPTADEDWWYDTSQVTLSTLGLEEGELAQCQLVRETADADDDLSGDLAVKGIAFRWY